MSEKKIKVNEVGESDKQFLDRSGATAQIRDAMAKIIENRPKDPITFLINYFQSFDGGTDLTMKTYQQLTLTHYTAPTFEINVKIAFDIFSSNKVIGKSNVRGITGASFMELLKLICRSYPAAVRESLLKKLHCYDEEAIPFTVFKYGVFVSFVMQDYLKQSRLLFSSLDVRQTDKVDKALCDAVVQYLQQVITLTNDSPQSVLEAGYMLRPDMVANSIQSAVGNKPKTTANLTTKDDFLLQAAESFLDKVSIS